MKTNTPALPLPASADEAERLVAQLKADISALKAQIASDELQRNAKALQLDDDAFEKAVLETDRSKRRLLRLEKQLEAAETQLTDAEAREEQTRCRGLYEAGLKAEKAVERLAAEYTKRASAVADVLREINKHAKTIRLADKSRPDYSPWFETYAIDVTARVVLPAATKGGHDIWQRGEPPPPPAAPIPQPVFANGRWIFADDDEYEAAVAAEKSRPSASPVAQRNAAPVSPHDMQTRPDGARAFKMPACEWPPAPEPKLERKSDGRKRLPTDGFYGEGATR